MLLFCSVCRCGRRSVGDGVVSTHCGGEEERGGKKEGRKEGRKEVGSTRKGRKEGGESGKRKEEEIGTGGGKGQVSGEPGFPSLVVRGKKEVTVRLG